MVKTVTVDFFRCKEQISSLKFAISNNTGLIIYFNLLIKLRFTFNTDPVFLKKTILMICLIRHYNNHFLSIQHFGLVPTYF